MFFNKKPGITFEYFANHWHHVHADLVTSSQAFKDLGFYRYNQFLHTPEMREKAQAMGFPAMSWDACTEFWVEKIEDFEAFTKTKEYIEATRKYASNYSIQENPGAVHDIFSARHITQANALQLISKTL